MFAVFACAMRVSKTLDPRIRAYASPRDLYKSAGGGQIFSRGALQKSLGNTSRPMVTSDLLIVPLK